MTWKVESITEADIEDLHELFSNAGPYVSARTLSDYWLYARLFSSTCLCIRDDTGKPIAALIAFQDQTPGIDEIYVQDVAVDGNHRRSGLGESLVREIKHLAVALGATRLWLTSDAGNTGAQELWKRTGFSNNESDYTFNGVWMTQDAKGPDRDRCIYELELLRPRDSD